MRRFTRYVGALVLLVWTGAFNIHGATQLKNSAPVPSVFSKSEPAGLPDLRLMERHIKQLLPKVGPTVVAIVSAGSTGSGVVVSAEGLVLSAAHVCGEPGKVVELIFSDGRKVGAKTLGTDHETDAGMLQITTPGRWPFAVLRDGYGLKVGEWVAAMGHPGGFDQERAVVFRLGRIIAQGSDVLQSDCTINAGDSGGPLFDMSGRLVGIHSRISFEAEDNYHVPMESFTKSWGRLERAENWGQTQPRAVATSGLAVESNESGLVVTRVTAGGPGALAGVKVNDVLLKVGGAAVKDPDEFRSTVFSKEPGDELELEIRRGEEIIKSKLTLTTRRRRGP